MSTVSLVENVVDNLRRELRKAKCTQAELARLADVRIATISDILTGKMEPSLSLCERIAKALKINASQIFLDPPEEAA
jgi:transcriptional regulator with XRE-family HTH domain